MSDQDPPYTRSAALAIAQRSDAPTPRAADLMPAPASPLVARDPVDKVVCGTGDASCASAHAGVLSRSMRVNGASVQQSLLRLQMRYGNQYVGRVLSRASSGGEPAQDMAGIERSIDSARSGGHGMDHPTRTRMETAFGADFSGVRIHTDSRADGLSRSLSARAFTTGQDVFFRQGEYRPGSSSGRELLAHELTHVVQQTGGGIHRKMTVSQPNDPHEVEADRMAHAVIQQEHAGMTDRQVIDREDAHKDEDKDKHLAAKPMDYALQRQPEALKPHDEEDKKKLHAKHDGETLARQREDESPE
jgi:hypothetical protein